MQPNSRKTQSIRRLGAVDIDALKAAVLALDEIIWQTENGDKPNKFEALDSTRHIVFRFVSSLNDWRESYDRPLWPDWKPLIEPVMDSATRDYGYSRGIYPRVMLARMRPGSVIQPHRDANPAAKWPHKIHIPLLTNDKAYFFVAGAPHHLSEGVAVEVNNMGVHSVTNGGNTDRIHLIFEYFDADQPNPEWLDSPTFTR